MRRKQFLLTTKEVGFLGGTTARVKAYNLFLGEDLNHTISVNHNVELHLLGVLHDWENPHLSNQENLDSIAQCDTIKEILSASDKYSGEFVIIVSINDDLYVFNDCCGQMEIYYDEAFSSFGTQPRLIGEVVDLIDHTDVSTIEYYQSQVFIKKCLFVGESTHKKNIFHLLPNHLLDLNLKKSQRFFPVKRIESNPLEYVSKRVSKMLKGYIASLANRSELRMAVTGGYDSRLLFLASLDVDCTYYVSNALSG